MTLQSHARSLLCAATALALAGCGGGGHYHGGSGGGMPIFFEVEPNGSPATANFVGTIAAGDAFAIRGQVADYGPDVFDGFAFFSLEPLDVEFVLTIDDPFADLDLCLYEPLVGAHTACWETGFNPEAGLFGMNGGYDFHLVVASFFGSSTYTLEVRGLPIAYPATAAAGASAAKGARPRPLEDYFTGGAGEGAVLEEAPLARGRLIEVDPQGEVRSRTFEATRAGIRIGPVTLDRGSRAGLDGSPGRNPPGSRPRPR